MATKEQVRETIADVFAFDEIPDVTKWAMVCNRLEMDRAELWAVLREDPGYYGFDEIPPMDETSP